MLLRKDSTALFGCDHFPMVTLMDTVPFSLHDLIASLDHSFNHLVGEVVEKGGSPCLLAEAPDSDKI